MEFNKIIVNYKVGDEEKLNNLIFEYKQQFMPEKLTEEEKLKNKIKLFTEYKKQITYCSSICSSTGNECGGELIITDNKGLLVCNSCGVVAIGWGGMDSDPSKMTYKEKQDYVPTKKFL